MSEPEFLPPLPQRVSLDAARAALERLGAEESGFFAELEARGGVLVEKSERSGYHEVTFAHPVGRATESVIVLIGTISHMLRDRLDHFVLERLRVGDTEIHAAAFALPSALRATVSLLVQPVLDLSIAKDRESWRTAYARTRALSRRVEVVRTSLGGEGSVLALPGAPANPWGPPEATGALARSEGLEPQRAPRIWGSRGELAGEDPGEGSGPARQSTVHRGVIHSNALGLSVAVWAAVPHASFGEPEGVMMLADGDCLEREYPMLAPIEGLHASGLIAPTLALFFAPRDPARRESVLGMNPALPVFIEKELLPWANRFVRVPTEPTQRVIGGASLGGLAAADVVRRAPGLVANAVVQSGSFWWPADDPDLEEELQLRLWERDGGALAGRVRLFHEVGDMEGHLLGVNREFRDLVVDNGIEASYREFVGGHDFANWRLGLLDAMLHFLPATPSP